MQSPGWLFGRGFLCKWKVSKEMLSNPRSPWQGIRNAARSRSVAERSGT